MIINGKTRTRFTFLKTFLEDFVTGVSHRMIWTVLKTDSGHVAFLTDNFFYISNPQRFFSSLKKTIVLYVVKKYETLMVIFTSERRRVFFKKWFFISASRTIHLTLNLQARHYRNINYYNIYTCSFTQYYLSMLRNKKASRTYWLLADICRTYSSCAASLCLQSYFWVRWILWLLKMTEKQDQRICIKFCFKLGKTSLETIEMMQKAFGNECMSKTQIKEWYNRFKGGSTSVDSDSRSCRPLTT